MKKYLKVFGIVSGISGILLIGVITAYFLLNRYPLSNATGETKNLKKEELLAYDKFYEGIFINDIDLKGLTKEEAISKIKQSLEVKNEFTLTRDNYTKKFLPKDIDFSYNFENLVYQAFNIGRFGTEDERIEILKNLLKNPKKFEIKATCDLSKLNEIVSEVSEKLNSDPIDEKFSFSNDKISVTEGKVGVKVENEKIVDNFKTVPVKFDFQIPATITEYKKIDKTLLSSIKGVIGEATTKFDNQPNRNNNIKVVDSIGGGICQVSSTLYQALVKSDLEIVERNQHSMRVPYCTIGLDAMYYDGQSDLKFRNKFDFPVVITSYVSKGELTFKILGDTDKKNYDIKLFTSDVSRIAMPIEEIKDPNLPEGKRVVVEKGFPGWRGSSYKQKENEKPVLLNSDYYKPKKQVVKVGTKKAVTEEKENND